MEVAVVGGEDDHRFVELARCAQRLDQLGDPAVDRRQGLEPALIAVADLAPLRRVEWRLGADEVGLVVEVALEHRAQVRKRRAGEPALVAARRHRPASAGSAAVRVQVLVVRGRLAELEEERRRARELADELGRALVEQVGQVGAIVVDLLALLAVDRELEVVVAARVADQRGPAIPPGRDLVLVVDVGLVAVQELAHVRGLVARALKPDREHVLVFEQGPVAGLVVEDAVVVAVLAGQVGGPRGTAERRRVVGVRERDPLAAEEPERVRHRAPVVGGVVLVVGEHEDDVRLHAEGGVGLDRRVRVLPPQPAAAPSTAAASAAARLIRIPRRGLLACLDLRR